LKFAPGSTIRWGAKRFVVVDYADMDSVVARELGKRRLERIPVQDAAPDRSPGDRAGWTADLVSIPQKAWQTAVKRFKALKPLIEMTPTERTLEKVQKAAGVVRKHPATVYRWIEAYERSERISAFLRKGRSDRGESRLSKEVDAIIETAINKIYLTAERPDSAAVIEEVRLQCFKSRIKDTPHDDTIRQRIAALPDRLKLEKRKGRKAAAEKYEPIKGIVAKKREPRSDRLRRADQRLESLQMASLSWRYHSLVRPVVSAVPHLVCPHGRNGLGTRIVY
jgi:putative transposase